MKQSALHFPASRHRSALCTWARLPALSPSSLSSSAFAQNVPVVRDAEIEALVRDYARPIFNAAGLSKSGIDIILVNDFELQRLRRRPPHVHQHRRAAAVRDAERDHRRHRT